MTSTNYATCHLATLKFEGGWSNHPRDPGGATMRGVTQRVYDAYRSNMGLDTRTVRNIADDELAEIYKKNYWRPVAGPYLPDGFDFVAYDGGVNSGPSRGVKWLQKALRIRADGAAGPVTINAANASRDRVNVIKRACAARLGFLQALRHWATFKGGWAKRVATVEVKAIMMLKSIEEVSTQRDTRTHVVRTEAAKAKKKVKAHTSAATGSGVGGAGGQVELEGFLSMGIGIAAVALIAYFLWRAHVHRQRTKAYKGVMEQ